MARLTNLSSLCNLLLINNRIETLMQRLFCICLFLLPCSWAFLLRYRQGTISKTTIWCKTDSTIGENDKQTEQNLPNNPLSDRAALKAQEVFVSRNTGKFECQACGYIYDEEVGVPQKQILPGISFESLEKFRCPQCGANKKYFVAETETVSGFKNNLKFGLGANSLTGDQKGALIFGGLFLGFLVFMSGYLLE